MSIYQRGTMGCTACQIAKKTGKIQRYKNDDGEWRFYRSCHWCGCCYPVKEKERTMITATTQIVDPQTGEVLAQEGDVNPERFLDYLEVGRNHPEQPWDQWFTDAYNSCIHMSQ